MVSSCAASIDSQPIGPTQESSLYHYVIVRADLPHGMQVAQVVHAAGESAPSRVPSGTSAVALAVPNEAILRVLDGALTVAGIPHVLIVESDGQAMAIGCEPTADRSHIRRITSSLPLVGKERRN